MPERATPEWDDARLDRRLPIPVIELDLPMGSIYFSERLLTEAELSTVGQRFSSVVKYRATVHFVGGRNPLDNLGRLVSVTPASESAQPHDGDVLGAVGRVERHGISLELANGDGVLSDLIGEHYVLGREVRYISSFAGLAISLALPMTLATVKRLVLTAERLTLDAE